MEQEQQEVGELQIQVRWEVEEEHMLLEHL
jgi:hypothetical protein